MRENGFHHLDRKSFRGKLDYHLHPSNHIELPAQLYGRERALTEMQDAFETPGAHPFIWGVRGVGKTSLGHTACHKHTDIVQLVSAVACGKDFSFRELIDDILLDAFRKKKSIFSVSRIKGALKAYGVKISAEVDGLQSTRTSVSVNQAASLLNEMFNRQNYDGRIPVIIVDEFDRLMNPATLEQVSDLLKQLSVLSAELKLCFCGVTDDLGELLSSHQSVDRYIFGVELRPVPIDAMWRLVSDICNEFGMEFGRGRIIRLSQIAAGYPHFAHLIVKNTLLEAYELQWPHGEISDEIFRGGLNRSSSQAATRLRTTYEDAIRRGTDRYIEVLFATANSTHMNRQFKDILADYDRIMEGRPNREGYDTSKANGQDLRNALDNLHKRGFLKKGASGWYQFHDPMLRSYVRLVAETEGVELSDDAFQN